MKSIQDIKLGSRIVYKSRNIDIPPSYGRVNKIINNSHFRVVWHKDINFKIEDYIGKYSFSIIEMWINNNYIQLIK